MNRSVAFGSILLGTTMLSSSFAMAQEAGSAGAAETIVVRGEFIPNQQRTTSQVATFVTDIDLARAGDDTAALALTRLSGLSVVGDRFAYVRGLGERYSLAMLNGSPLPSPEPLRRTVPLDLFPSELLDGIAVQKTFSANYPGDFGGGVIDMKTLRQPTENYFGASASVGYNTVNADEKGIFVYGSDSDWTGYDDGLRKVPAELKNALASGSRIDQLPADQVERVGESLVNSPLSVIQTGDLDPNVSLSFRGARKFDLPSYSVSVVGAAGYGNDWRTAVKTREVQESGQTQSGKAPGVDPVVSRETTNNINTNALVSAALLWGEQTLQTTVFYTHATSKEAQIDTGFKFNRAGSGEVWDESSGWYERDLAMFQLSGEHGLGPLELSWRTAASRSTRDAPYQRTLDRLLINGVPNYLETGHYTINFSQLEDTNFSYGADLSYDFNIGDRDGTVTVGGDHSQTLRDYDFLALRFEGNAGAPDTQIARPDFLFSPDNITPSRFVLDEFTQPNDSYKASLDIDALYAQADVEVVPYVRTTVGVRWEDAEERARTFNRFGDLGAQSPERDKDYVLPSLLATWNFYEDMQLRFGYSQTITRPQFRELAASSYFDPEEDRSYIGNSFLVDSKLKNYDVRYEYYLGRDAFLTLAGFYKEIERPIEEVSFSNTNFGSTTTFFNSPKANLQGAELEFRKYFQSPLSAAFFADRDWLLAFNYTYTKSEVQVSASDLVVDPVSTATPQLVPASFYVTDGSALQGAPENILNLQTGWRSPDDQFTILLGWVDERIVRRGFNIGGGRTQPDVIEDPGVQLDLTYQRYLDVGGTEVTLALAGRNLLDEDHVEYQTSPALGETQFNTYERGRTISVSVATRF